MVLVVGQDQDPDQEEEEGLDIGMKRGESVCGKKRLGKILPAR